MKDKKGIWFTFFPLFLTIGVYLLFFHKDAACGPSDAIFWMIIAMGMSLGVTVSHFFIMMEKRNKDSE